MPGLKLLDELNELHHDLLDLVTCFEEAVMSAVREIREPVQWAVTPEATETEALAESGHRIQERCQRILLLYQPVATDFRLVTATLRLAADWEHISSLATEIAEYSADLTTLPVHVQDELARMATVVSRMVRDALISVPREALPTRRIARGWAEVAERGAALTNWLTEAMHSDPAAVEPGLSLFAVVRNLRRIATYSARLVEVVEQPLLHRFS